MASKASNDAALVAMHRASHSTQKGAEAILKHVRDNGLPCAISASSQRRARQKFCQKPTPYGPVVQEIKIATDNDTDISVYVNNPFAILFRSLEECKPFSDIVLKTLIRNPTSAVRKWGIVVYFDEVSPSDPLSPHVDERQIQCVYWTFREFAPIIHHEEVWFVLTCVRSTQVALLKSAMSELLKVLLSRLFFDPKGHHMSRSGVALNCIASDGTRQPFRLYAEHEITISDFKATKEVLCSMGHNGIKPCPICRNIYKDDVADGDELLGLSCLECNRWRAHTDDSIRKLQTYLSEKKPTLSKAGAMSLETRMGYHYYPSSILNDTDLKYKAISTLMFDWPHIYFIQGLFKVEFEAFFDLSRALTPNHLESVVSYKDLNAYVQQWVWPDRYQSCARAFLKGKLGATASEQLSVAPVVRKFFADVVMGSPDLSILHNAADSVRLCCEAIELLEGATRLINTPEEVHNGIMAHLKKHQEVHGTAFWVFKHHQAGHLGGMFRAFGRLFNTFVTERRHKDPKRFAMSNTGRAGYEKGLMEELCCQHFHDWDNFTMGTAKAGKALPQKLFMQAYEMFPTAMDIQTSLEFVSDSGAKFRKGDFALLGGERLRFGGIIWYHFLVDGIAWSVVSVWKYLGSNGRCGRYEVLADSPQVFRSSDLASLAIYKPISAGIVIVIMPFAYFRLL